MYDWPCSFWPGDTNKEALEDMKEAIEFWPESARELGIRIAEKEVVSVESSLIFPLLSGQRRPLSRPT